MKKTISSLKPLWHFVMDWTTNENENKKYCFILSFLDTISIQLGKIVAIAPVNKISPPLRPAHISFLPSLTWYFPAIFLYPLFLLHFLVVILFFSLPFLILLSFFFILSPQEKKWVVSLIFVEISYLFQQLKNTKPYLASLEYTRGSHVVIIFHLSFNIFVWKWKDTVEIFTSFTVWKF